MCNDPQIIIAPTYDDSRAKIALWNDPQMAEVGAQDDMLESSMDISVKIKTNNDMYSHSFQTLLKFLTNCTATGY